MFIIYLLTNHIQSKLFHWYNYFFGSLSEYSLGAYSNFGKLCTPTLASPLPKFLERKNGSYARRSLFSSPGIPNLSGQFHAIKALLLSNCYIPAGNFGTLWPPKGKEHPLAHHCRSHIFEWLSYFSFLILFRIHANKMHYCIFAYMQIQCIIGPSCPSDHIFVFCIHRTDLYRIWKDVSLWLWDPAVLVLSPNSFPTWLYMLLVLSFQAHKLNSLLFFYFWHQLIPEKSTLLYFCCEALLSYKFIRINV